MAFPPRSSLLCVPHHPTAITAMAAMAALTAMGQCMPMNCSRQCKVNQSSEFQCLFRELPPACAKGSNGFLNPPQSPLSLQVPATHLQSARPSAAVSQACPRPCIIYSQRGERTQKKTSHDKTVSIFLLLKGTTMLTERLQTYLKIYENLIQSLYLSGVYLILVF